MSYARVLGIALVTLTGLACRDEVTSPSVSRTPRAQTPPPSGPGLIMLAGGGSEGAKGDTSAWSYKLYSRMVRNGDITGDGVVRIAVVSRLKETTFIPHYFEWIGTTLGIPVEATNYTVASIADANSAAVVGAIADADAVFIKGGDQGQYFDLWNGTLLETNIAALAARGGALGGTSAGAMSLAQYCICSGQDYVSSDVLSDAQTQFLNDLTQPGTSGIHADFLPYVAGSLIDTHFTFRGRLGRLLGALAKTTADFGDNGILAIGIEQTTGLALRRDTAEVIGTGSVSFITQTRSSTRLRDAGHPLVYTNLHEDRLTEGWRYVLSARAPVTASPPAGVSSVTYPGDGATNVGALSIDGATESDNAKLELVAAYDPSDYSLSTTSVSPFVRRAVGFTNSDNSNNRGAKQETVYRALVDRTDAIGLLAFSGGSVTRSAAEPDKLSFGGTSAAIVIDGKRATFKGLSPDISNLATKKGTLVAGALTNLTLHVLAESAARGIRFDSRTHALSP